MRIDIPSEEQSESIVDLLCEVNAYYNPDSPASRAVVREHALGNLLSNTSSQKLVVASAEDGVVVGLAAIAIVYSIVEPEPERRTQCQLEELFVSSSWRSKRVGRALMHWVAKYALEHGCCRIDWPVKAANVGGIAFYRSLGAQLVEDRLSFRLNGQPLGQLAEHQDSVRSAA